METEVKTKRLISEQRCKDENLDFIEECTVDDEGAKHIRYKIIDGVGVGYNAISLSDGMVFDGYTTYYDTQTFERFQGPADILCGWWWAEWRHEIIRDRAGEIYLLRYHKNVGPSDFMEHMASANELAEILFDPQEQEILEFPNTGHWAVYLPEDVREELITTAHRRRDEKSLQEMIVERLRHAPFTEESVPQGVREMVHRIRQRKAAEEQSVEI